MLSEVEHEKFYNLGARYDADDSQWGANRDGSRVGWDFGGDRVGRGWNWG